MVPAPVRRIPAVSIDLLTRGAMRIILIFRRPDPMISGRNVCSVATFLMSRPVKVGEARRTAMAHVKSAIETDASSAL
jgi:hypothetical protein